RTLALFVTPSPSSELPTLSLHDALPISESQRQRHPAAQLLAGLSSLPDRLPAVRRRLQPELSFWLRQRPVRPAGGRCFHRRQRRDRKSTRLNSSHVSISYAVFCLKKKNT